MPRRLANLAILYALVCYLGFLCFDGFLFLVSHLPPQVVHLDWFISWLGALARVFTLPRRLPALWPGEASPTALNYLLTALNWLC